MRSCKEVARLVAAGDADGLGGLSRLMIRWHLLTCEHCKRYRRELRGIAAAARALMTSEPLPADRLARVEQSILAELRMEQGAPDPRRK